MSIIQMIFMNRSNFYILSCNCSYRIWKIFYLWNFIRFWIICHIKSNHMLTTTSHFLAISFQLCNSLLSFSKKWKLEGNYKKIKILLKNCTLVKDDIFISNMASRLYEFFYSMYYTLGCIRYYLLQSTDSKLHS